MSDSKVVLLVEDEVILRNLQVRFLSRHGYTVIGVSNGEDALEALQNHRIDIAILDVNIGQGPSGLDILAQLKQSHPEIRTIISSGDVESVYNHNKSEQPDVYLAKPFRMEKLLNLL